MDLIYSKFAESDFNFIKKNGNIAIKKRLDKILEELETHPKTGIGSPEQLKHDLTGYWSRELTKKDRIVYQIDEDKGIVVVHQLLGHYFDK
jgi:toxin YoeB